MVHPVFFGNVKNGWFLYGAKNRVFLEGGGNRGKIGVKNGVFWG